MKLTFLGAAGTVTGSKYLVSSGTQQLLVDCGLFQGLKRLRERNWQRLPFDGRSLAAVLLTHAHIDHSGYLPVLARSGFGGPVYCTVPTARLLAIMLPDSARLQEEDARYANRHRFSKHSPALPLYTEADAAAALKLLRPVEWSTEVALLPGVTGRLSPAGHLLGAGSVLLDMPEGRLLFSGDLGRSDDPIMLPPAPPPAADWLVIESTYGDRLHPALDAQSELADILNRALARSAVVVIPAFAVGRAQSLLHLIASLKAQRRIPEVPVFLNSPMATDVTEIYREFSEQHRLSVQQCRDMCSAAKIVNSVEESKHLNTLHGPMIIVSASGMATGGRVLHHLKAFAPDARNLILFSGYQAAGTRGAAMVSGADAIKMHGDWIPVRAEVAQLQAASSHADRNELLAWLRRAPRTPAHIFVTHGEPSAADTLRQYLRREFGTEVLVPEQGEQVELKGAGSARLPGAVNASAEVQ